MKCINIFGGPGIGKSTQSLLLTAHLKLNHYNADIVQEYAKSLVYRNDFEKLSDQRHILDVQTSLVETLKLGGVEYAVCECPILLNIVYNNLNSPNESYNLEVLEHFNRYDNHNLVLNRSTKFVQNGRIHNLEESKSIDRDIINTLNKYNIEYTNICIENFLEDSIKIIKNL